MDSRVKNMLTQARTETSNLYSARMRTTAQLHDLYRQITEICIRILEQVIHGSVSRATKAEADYLASVAEGMSKKLEMQHRQLALQVDSAEAPRILASRVRAMHQQYADLRRQSQSKEDTLSRLGSKHDPDLIKEYLAVVNERKSYGSQP